MKYQGSDGWIHDDDVDGSVPRRYKNKENTRDPKAAKPPSERPKLTSCPNCSFSVSWRKEQDCCDHCGWGKKPEDWDNFTPPPPSAIESGEGVLACCGFIGASIIACLVGMGMGYGIGGWGGLLVGLGLGAAIPVGLIFMMNSATSKKET